MSDVSISRQKLDIDEAIAALRKEKAEIEYKIKVLTVGYDALLNGENLLESNSVLATEVRKIMAQS